MPTDPAPDAAERARARALFLQRFAELVHPDSDIGRRARTLNIRTAIEEASALAASFVRSGGRTRNVAEPRSAGHGIAMLPDVGREALDLLSDDVVLKRKHPEIVDPLRIALEKLAREEPDCDSSTVAELDAYAAHLARTYCCDALQLIRTIITNRPRELLPLEIAAQGLVSDLRARGWTDQALLDKVVTLGTANDFDAAFDVFSGELTAPARRFTCYVAVTTQEVEDQLPNEPDFHVVAAVPGPPAGFPTQGPYILTAVDAVDPRVAADIAVARVASVIGAVAIFVRQDVLVRSRFVAVAAPGSAPVSVDSSSPLPREPRIPRAGQVARIAQSTLRTSKRRLEDAVFEAMRHLRRAGDAGDAESRFMLLWLGLERLVLGADHDTILQAARELVPPAITLGKVRRDVEALARSLAAVKFTPAERAQLHELVGGPHGKRPLVDQERLLTFLVADEAVSRQLTRFFYDKDARLIQWYFQLRKALAGGDPRKIADYIENSRSRVERQVLRLYRARNSVAHAARGPAWLGELTRHASFYLTNLIAMVLHYREQDPGRAPIDILVARAGQYAVYTELLRRGSPKAAQPVALLRPTSVVAAPRI